MVDSGLRNQAKQLRYELILALNIALIDSFNLPFSNQVMDSTDVARVLVHVDHTRRCDVRSSQHFAKEALGCSSTAGLVQEEIERLSGGIDYPIQVPPSASDLDVGLIDAPGIIGLLELGAAAFFQFRSIPLDPAKYRGMVD